MQTKKRPRSSGSGPLSDAYKSVCQLEGSDHGGRDAAAELALAGTIDSMSNDPYNRLTLVSAPPDAKNYTLRGHSVNDFVREHVNDDAQDNLAGRRAGR